MNGEEHGLARDVRRQLEKRPLDVTQAVVTVSKSVVYISGQIKPSRSCPDTDVKDEMDVFRKQALRMGREVKDVIIEARLIMPPKKEHVENKDGAGHLPGRHH